MQFSRILAVTAALALAGTAAHAQQFFRIGTGGTAGNSYPVGGAIANAVSQPGKIIFTAQASNGSVANVNGIAGGAMESGFSQANVATWAQKGTGMYEGKPNVPGLRLIANLYPERVHVVVKKGSGIKSVADLKGKRVALDEPGSGTLINARAILAVYGLKESRAWAPRWSARRPKPASRARWTPSSPSCAPTRASSRRRRRSCCRPTRWWPSASTPSS